MAECEGPESKTMKIIPLGDLPLYSPFISVELKCICCSIGKFTPGSFKKYNLFSIKDLPQRANIPLKVNKVYLAKFTPKVIFARPNNIEEVFSSYRVTVL